MRDFRRVAFQYERDVPRLQGFLARMRQAVSQAAYLQLGDLLWRIHYPANAFDASTDLPIWEDELGEVCGFGLFLRHEANPEFQLDPRLYESPLGEAAVAWAVDVAKAYGMSGVETSCTAGDAAKAHFLASYGFRCIGDPMLFQARRLDDPVAMSPPPGYIIAPLRLDLQARSATGLEPFPFGSYERMRMAVGYRWDLDVKAYHAHEIVAGCICWLDAVGCCGELEPVGTHSDHRRRGLASACIALALNALRHYGATWAYVRPHKESHGAVALYESLGFVSSDEDLGWRLDL